MVLSFQSISANLFTIICSQTFTGKTQISFLILIMEISQLQSQNGGVIKKMRNLNIWQSPI